MLVRLLTGSPPEEYARCLRELTRMIEQEDAGIFASNQVIGECCNAVQHHYGVSKATARSALTNVLTSGLVSLLMGKPYWQPWRSRAGPAYQTG